MVNKKFLAAMFTLSGTIIGAGILGLPYVFAKSGFLIGIFWLLVIGSMILYVNLALGEITLRTKGNHQLPGYANRYLGKWGKRIMFFALVFGIYSALLAYLIGEGNSFAKLIPFDVSPIFYGIIFWMFMTMLLGHGMKELKRIETWGVMTIIVIVFGMFCRYLHNVDVGNLVTINHGNLLFPIGVVFFAMHGFSSMPEVRREIKGRESLFKKAIIFGTLIPIVLYILFSVIFIGRLGTNINEVATLSFGPFVTVLGIFTMLTSYFVLSFALHDMYKYDIKLNKVWNFALTSFIPLVLYILIQVFKLASFNEILGIGGTVSSGIMGIIILVMAKKAKNNPNNPNPKINIPISWIAVVLLSLAFSTAIILELFF